ncbi:unnamed protein product [Musa banksii]
MLVFILVTRRRSTFLLPYSAQAPQTAFLFTKHLNRSLLLVSFLRTPSFHDNYTLGSLPTTFASVFRHPDFFVFFIVVGKPQTHHHHCSAHALVRLRAMYAKTLYPTNMASSAAMHTDVLTCATSSPSASLLFL